MNQKYERQEFPKVVYGPNGLADTVTIANEQERPDGYFDAKDVIIAGEYSYPKGSESLTEAEIAKQEAKEAEKAYRAEMRAYLDEHNVDYAKNISTKKMADLVAALDEHLANQESEDEAEGSDEER